jgi:hypothetical protein
MNASGAVDIYNNWIESTGEHGIKVWTHSGPKPSEKRGPFKVNVWNNVIVDAGLLRLPGMSLSYGISIGAQDGTEKPVPTVYSNTIVQSRDSAIDISRNVGSGVVRDNVVAGFGNPAIKTPSIVKQVNNRVGSVVQMAFLDPLRKNFRLSTNSPARNEGSSSYPKTDFDDVARPKGGAPDQGAFEPH